MPWGIYGRDLRLAYQRAMQRLHKRLTAIHFTPFGELSGAQRSMIILVAEQARRQPVGVWALYESSVDQLARESGASIWLGNPGAEPDHLEGARAGDMARFRLYAERLGARILHCHSAFGMRWARGVARDAGLKLVCHQRDNYVDDDFHRYLADADWIVANSRAVLETLPAELRAKTSVAHNATTIKHLKRAPRAKSIRIGMAGRSIAEKGAHLFLDAVLPMVETSSAEAHIWGLWSMGPECSLSKSLVDRVERLPTEVRKRIDLQPFREDIEEFFAKMDVVVVPSIFPEPFGRMAIEAMASGCAVVAAGHGGLLEIVDDNTNGLLFTPGSAESLRAALDRVVGDSRLREALIQQGRVAVEKNFTPVTHYQGIQAVYESLLNR